MTESTAPVNVRRDLSESRVLGSMVLGAGLSLAFYGLVIRFLVPGTYVAAAFTERGWIPYLTTFLCGTGICLLVFAFLRIRREETTFVGVRAALEARTPLDREAATLALDDVREVRKSAGGHIVANRFLRAMHAVEEGIKTKSELGETLRNLGDIDISILQATHLPVKYIIWLIPVLGFTGTVLGISTAISGFTLLIEGAQDLGATKGALGAVALNLGVAFETTLLALIKTAILMYAFSMLQKRERSFFINVDEYCADDLLKRVVPLPRPRGDKSEVAILSDEIEALTGRLATWDPRFSETLDGFFGRLEELSGASDERVAARLTEFGTTCEEFSAAAAQTALRGTGAATTMAEAAERFAVAVERIDAVQTQLNTNLDALTKLDAFRGSLEALRDSVAVLPDAVEALGRPRRITLVESADGND